MCFEGYIELILRILRVLYGTVKWVFFWFPEVQSKIKEGTAIKVESTLNILSKQTINIFNQYKIVWDKSFRFSSFDNLHGNSGAYHAAMEMRHANITKP